MPINYVISEDHPRGKVETVTLENGEIWKLVGECNRCGQCCELGCPTKEFNDAEGNCQFYFKETVNGEELGACKIIWNRPYGCVMYPSNPYEELLEKCSYSWERIK